MIEKANIDELTRTVNHPAVLPAMVSGAEPGEDHIDLSGFYRANKGRNVALKDGAGIMLFCPDPNAPAEYEAHFLFPPPIRGKRLLGSARAMIETLFTQYGAGAIVVMPPRDHRAVRHVLHLLDFRQTGNTVIDSQGRDCPVYRRERDHG